MSDERAGAAGSQPKDDPRKNKHEDKRPVWDNGKPVDLAEGWEIGESTKLPIRGDARYVELRSQPLVSELAQLARLDAREGNEAADSWLRELAIYLTGWGFTYPVGPRQGQVIDLPPYDPYELSEQKRLDALNKRIKVLQFITTDDLFKIQNALRWLREEVRVRYLDPPIAPSSDSEGSSASPSA